MVPAGGRFGSGVVPNPEVVARVRRMLTQRLGMQPADAEDVMSEAVLEVLSAPRDYSRSDGLFLVIARRRAFDFWRHRKVELSFREMPTFSLPDRDHIDSVLLQRSLLRFVQGKTELEQSRVLGVARAVLEGSSYAEACRKSGIPRGSQGRYRETLKAFLAYLERVRSRGRVSTR